MLRFLHSGDWQLGITREFLGDEAQARWAQARFDAVRRIGSIAREEAAEFVLVAGDVFETNQVDRRTILRAAEALAAIPVPVYLLPGNHDPLDAAAIWRSPAFSKQMPERVRVLDDRNPREVRPGVEVVGAPWTSKRPLADLVAALAESLAPAPGALRIAVAHGMVDCLDPDPDRAEAIAVAAAERALAEQRFHYLALGDRHSLTRVGGTGRIWYAGTPEPTDWDEVDPGHVLVVEIDGDAIQVRPRRVGTWSFFRESWDLAGRADVEALARALAARPDKERSAGRLALVGQLTLAEKALLDATLGDEREVYAALTVSPRRSRLAVRADDSDFSGLELEGYARAGLERLRARLAAGGEDAKAAEGALALLLRLARNDA